MPLRSTTFDHVKPYSPFHHLLAYFDRLLAVYDLLATPCLHRPHTHAWPTHPLVRMTMLMPTGFSLDFGLAGGFARWRRSRVSQRERWGGSADFTSSAFEPSSVRPHPFCQPQRDPAEVPKPTALPPAPKRDHCCACQDPVPRLQLKIRATWCDKSVRPEGWIYCDACTSVRCESDSWVASSCEAQTYEL